MAYAIKIGCVDLSNEKTCLWIRGVHGFDYEYVRGAIRAILCQYEGLTGMNVSQLCRGGLWRIVNIPNKRAGFVCFAENGYGFEALFKSLAKPLCRCLGSDI